VNTNVITLPSGYRQGDVVFSRVEGVAGSSIDEAFILTDGPFGLVFARARFSAGSGTATLTIGQVAVAGTPTTWDVSPLWSETLRGTGADFSLRVAESGWVFDGVNGFGVRFTWTSPHASMLWGLEVGLCTA